MSKCKNVTKYLNSRTNTRYIMKNEKIIEIVEAEPWKFKIRSLTNPRRWYNIIQRKDASFYCSCNSYKYQTQECKHLEIIKKVTMNKTREINTDKAIFINDGIRIEWVRAYNNEIVITINEPFEIRKVSNHYELCKIEEIDL